MEKLKQYNRAVELKAVAAETTAGPLKVELVAVANGRVVLAPRVLVEGELSKPHLPPSLQPQTLIP